MDNVLPAENVFRVENGKYIHNNTEIPKEEFDRLKQQADQAMGIIRNTTGKRVRPSMEDRKKAASAELDFKRGGKVSSASKRADGCAQRGKTKGRMV